MKKNIPLAEAMRPRVLSDVVGQDHLLGKGALLREMLDSGTISSLLLWGHSGVGKTSIARLISQVCDCDFYQLSAVLTGVKDLRLVIEKATHSEKATILFIDEIHRFNKSQQDALLPSVESGLIILIGATTENPAFEVNSALLSRLRVLRLDRLTQNNLKIILNNIMDKILPNIRLDPDAEMMILQHADGDARRLCNCMEDLAKYVTKSNTDLVTKEVATNCLTKMYRMFDKKGDDFYDQISALHKSVRGSNPDAALYWLCRMLDGGCDPKYIIRRIIRMSWEDIGVADVRAQTIALSCAQTYDRLGSPEGELALGVAIVYLSVASKSNKAYSAFLDASQFVETDQSREVPIHLRNAPTRLAKDAGHGKDYKYAHDYPDQYVPGERYLPEGVKVDWYKPGTAGLEKLIKERLEFLRSKK